MQLITTERADGCRPAGQAGVRRQCGSGGAYSAAFAAHDMGGPSSGRNRVDGDAMRSIRASRSSPSGVRPPNSQISVFYLNVHGQLSRGVTELAQEAGGRDVLVFTGTWLGEGQQPPDIAGYRAYNYSRPAALQTGHARGGLACYIRQELCGHVHHVTCDPTSSFAVLRVSKEAGFEQDLYLIVCYIAPRCSTSISIASRSIWAQLEDSVSAALSKGQVLVVGDLNARTGTNADYTLYNIVDEHVPIGASPTNMQRSSQDGIVNSHGRELLGLCRRTGLRIVNGRVSGDETGAFTFVCPSGGASLIDYVIACPSAFGLVSQFAVVPAPCSDHLALQFSLVTDIHTA